jgi:hypothetical protein
MLPDGEKHHRHGLKRELRIHPALQLQREW